MPPHPCKIRRSITLCKIGLNQTRTLEQQKNLYLSKILKQVHFDSLSGSKLWIEQLAWYSYSISQY